MRDGWATSMLMREAFANVFSRRARAYLLVVVAVVLGALQVVVAAVQQAHLTDELARLRADGRNVAVIASSSADHPAYVDARSCDALTADPAVERAGILTPVGRRDFAQIGADVPVLAASPGLFPQLRTVDAVVGAALVQGAAPRRVVADDGTVLESVVVGEQPRGVDTNSAVVVRATSATTAQAQCVVVLDVYADAHAVLPRLTAELQASGGNLTATEAMRGGADPLQLYRADLTRHLPLACGVVLALLAVALVRTRAGELAAYRLSGTSRRSLWLLLTLELLCVAGVLVAAGAITAVALSGSLRDPTVAVLEAALGAFVFLAVALPLSALVASGNPIDLEKDR